MARVTTMASCNGDHRFSIHKIQKQVKWVKRGRLISAF